MPDNGQSEVKRSDELANPGSETRNVDAQGANAVGADAKLRQEALGWLNNHQAHSESIRSNESLQAYNDKFEPIDRKIIRTASQVGLATIQGAGSYGITHAVDHPLQFGAEMVGAVVLPIALRGPAWVKVPATLVAGVGGVTFGFHVADAVTTAAPAIRDLWDSPSNTKSSTELIRQSLGPVAFDTALMGGMGILGNRAATKLHEVDPLALRASLTERASGLAQAFGIANQEVSFAGVGRIPETRLPTRVEPSKVNLAEPMQMAAHDGKAGAGGRNGTRSGSHTDNYRYVRQDRPNGEVVHDFVNAKVGSVHGNTFNHQDGTKLFFGHDGRVQVTFGTGQVRTVHLGQSIGHINIVEKPSGLKEFRLNGSDKPQMATEAAGNTIKAKLSDGSILRHTDVVEPVTFNHKDGLKTTIDPYGRVIFQIPGGAPPKVMTLNDRIGQVRILDHSSGQKEINLWNRDGNPLASKIDVPPLPKALTQQKPQNLLAQQWREMQQKGTGAGMEAGPTGTAIRSTVDMTPQHQGKGDDNPFWRLPLPQTPHRAIVDTVMGLDHRTMPQSDMRAASDIGLAIQDHNWVVKDFLAGLGKGGKGSGFDFDF